MLSVSILGGWEGRHHLSFHFIVDLTTIFYEMLFEFLSIRNQYILRMIWSSSLNITDTKIFEDFKQLMFPSH